MSRTAARALLAGLAAVAVALAACGGSGTGTAGGASTGDAVVVSGAASEGAVTGDPTRAATLGELLGLPAGAPVAAQDVIVAGSADLPAGRPLRLPFAILGKGGEAVIADGPVQVFAATGTTTALSGPFDAVHSPIVVSDGGAQLEAGGKALYVAHDLAVPTADLYDVVAVYEVGGERRAASGQLRFLDHEETPAVGDPAIPSKTPTLADVGGDATRLTTRTPPDTSLLEHSVAGSLKDGKPFVLAFATPEFCTSRICGPVVDVVLDVQKRMADTPMRFIHVEIFKDNDPQQGPNQWVQEWRLPTEPWVFVVGANGRIASKFEGAVSADELEAAARAALGG